jgi:hypothetical protein
MISDSCFITHKRLIGGVDSRPPRFTPKKGKAVHHPSLGSGSVRVPRKSPNETASRPAARIFNPDSFSV